MLLFEFYCFKNKGRVHVEELINRNKNVIFHSAGKLLSLFFCIIGFLYKMKSLTKIVDL